MCVYTEYLEIYVYVYLPSTAPPHTLHFRAFLFVVRTKPHISIYLKRPQFSFVCFFQFSFQIL